jgi:hypothetical protein
LVSAGVELRRGCRAEVDVWQGGCRSSSIGANRPKTAGQVFEGAVADAQKATTKVPQAESLLQDVLAGSHSPT